MNSKSGYRALALTAILSLTALFTPAIAQATDMPSAPIVTCGAVSFDNIPTGWIVTISPGTAEYGATDMPLYLAPGVKSYEWLSDTGTDTGIGGHFGILGCTPPVGPDVTTCASVTFSGISANWTVHMGLTPNTGANEVVYTAADFPLSLAAGHYWYQWYDSYGLGQSDPGFSGEFTVVLCPTPTPSATHTATPTTPASTHTPSPAPNPTHTASPVPLPSVTPTASPSTSPSASASLIPILSPTAISTTSTASPCVSACLSAEPDGLSGGSNGGDNGVPLPLVVLGALVLGLAAFAGGLVAANRRRNGRDLTTAPVDDSEPPIE